MKELHPVFGEQLSLGGIALGWHHNPGSGNGFCLSIWVVWHDTLSSCHRGFSRSLAHRLGCRSISHVHLTLFQFSPLRGVCSFSFLCFSREVLRKKTTFECHVILERIFQQISKISKIVVDHRMPLQKIASRNPKKLIYSRRSME